MLLLQIWKKHDHAAAVSKVSSQKMKNLRLKKEKNRVVYRALPLMREVTTGNRLKACVKGGNPRENIDSLRFQIKIFPVYRDRFDVSKTNIIDIDVTIDTKNRDSHSRQIAE